MKTGEIILSVGFLEKFWHDPFVKTHTTGMQNHRGMARRRKNSKTTGNEEQFKYNQSQVKYKQRKRSHAKM